MNTSKNTRVGLRDGELGLLEDGILELVCRLVVFGPLNCDVFEPDAIRVLDTLTPRYVETQVYHAILEAIASEHSARMVAMKNATDNANELIDNLTLDLNKARQESITSELLDMVGGAAAVAG